MAFAVQADECDAYGLQYVHTGDLGTKHLEKLNLLFEVTNMKPDVGDSESRHREFLSQWQAGQIEEIASLVSLTPIMCLAYLEPRLDA